MTATITSVPRPLDLDLTREYLLSIGLDPLYGGSFWKRRFQVKNRDTGLGVSLSSATIIFAIRDQGTLITTRKSGVTSTGAPTAQIVPDAQGSEDTVNGTGTGWFSLYCYAVTPEIAEFTTLLANSVDLKTCDYEIAIKFGDLTTQSVVYAGKIDVCKPKNTFPIT
jgi:hypothetical protein